MPVGRRTLEERMIGALLRRKSAYERYFKTNETRKPKGAKVDQADVEARMIMDNQAQNAYTSIVKTIVELSRKYSKEAKDPEEMKRLAEEIFEREYGMER